MLDKVHTGQAYLRKRINMTSLTGLDYHPIGINPFCDMGLQTLPACWFQCWQLQATDSNTCGHYALFFLFTRARGKSMESFFQPLNISEMFIRIIK